MVKVNVCSKRKRKKLPLHFSCALSRRSPAWAPKINRHLLAKRKAFPSFVDFLFAQNVFPSPMESSLPPFFSANISDLNVFVSLCKKRNERWGFVDTIQCCVQSLLWFFMFCGRSRREIYVQHKTKCDPRVDSFASSTSINWLTQNQWNGWRKEAKDGSNRRSLRYYVIKRSERSIKRDEILRLDKFPFSLLGIYCFSNKRAKKKGGRKRQNLQKDE